MSQVDLVDISLILKELTDLAESIRKEASTTRDVLSRVICLRWVQEHMNAGGKAPPVYGELATGTPNVRQMSSIPRIKNDPERYKEFIEDLGIIDPHGVTTPHWPALIDHLSELAAAGKPLPAGLDPRATYPVYSVRLLRRKSISEWMDK